MMNNIYQYILEGILDSNKQIGINNLKNNRHTNIFYIWQEMRANI